MLTKFVVLAFLYLLILRQKDLKSLSARFLAQASARSISSLFLQYHRASLKAALVLDISMNEGPSIAWLFTKYCGHKFDNGGTNGLVENSMPLV